MSAEPTTNDAHREPLTKARLLTGAIELADRIGIEPFTIPRLAAELGVKPMTIYHHIANKEAIRSSRRWRTRTASEYRRIVGFCAGWRESLLVGS